MSKIRSLSFLIYLSLFLAGCSAVPVDSRYSGGQQTDTLRQTATEIKKDTAAHIPFYFDFSPYRSFPQIKQVNNVSVKRNPDYWYSFDDDPVRKNKMPVKVQGFRILVHTTDDYPEADSVRTALYLRTNKKSVYLDFESPFYKVKVGDYQFQRQAEELNFQLNQLGFRNTLVINDSVFVYK